MSGQALVNWEFWTSRSFFHILISPTTQKIQVVKKKKKRKSYISTKLLFICFRDTLYASFWICVYICSPFRQLGMPKMEACNMRSRGCTEPECSISTKNSRSPPPTRCWAVTQLPARRRQRRRSRDGRKHITIDVAVRAPVGLMMGDIRSHKTGAYSVRFWKYCRFAASVGCIIYLIISLTCLHRFLVQVWKMTWETSPSLYYLITETYSQSRWHIINISGK